MAGLSDLKQFGLGLSIASKLVLFLLFLITVSVFGSSYYIYQSQIDSLEQALGQQLERMARTSVHLIPKHEHNLIIEAYLDDQAAIASSSYFSKVQTALRLIKKENDLTSDVYTLVHFDWVPEKMIFMAMSQQQTYVGNGMALHPLVAKVLNTGRSTHSGLYEDTEGTWLSGFAPIKDEFGNVEAVLELDYNANTEIAAAKKNLFQQMLFPPLIATVVALIVAFLFGSRFTRPLRQLAAAAEKIGKGDYRVNLELQSGGDEVATLVVAFSQMMQELQVDRALIKDYTDNLETKVADRTKKLQQSKDKIEHAHNELRLKQSLLIQSEKMASLGIVTAGVAHEINTPMAYIISNISVLRDYFNVYMQLHMLYDRLLQSLVRGDIQHAQELQLVITEFCEIEKIEGINDDFSGALDDSMSGAKRVKDIVINLRSFSRTDDSEKTMANINDCLKSTVKIVWSEIKHHCNLHENYGDIPEIPCFPGQLNQVFLNLIINAGQSISTRGDITISTAQQEGNIVIKISDTGVGIAEQDCAQLFDPFFTTKPVGQGTGLGLSVSYDIIQKHEGDITVQSELGKGACFTISLPISRS